MLYKRILPFLIALVALPFLMKGQVTTGIISGSVKNAQGTDLPGATIEVIHVPSGSVYRSTTSKVGIFTVPSLRIGGPYSVTVTYVGFKPELISDVNVQLGEPTRLNVVLTDANTSLTEVVISGTSNKRGSLISKDRKGTATNINRRIISTLPTLSRNITDFTKLTPQANGTSFAGQDNRFINLTIDGSIFNNSFGLQALPGSQTSAAPISIDAIEEIQVNLSPYNVRDAGFTGASINAVTRSGTNTFHGSAFYNNRNQHLVGKNAGPEGKTPVTVANFDVKQYGASLGGPIIKNKLFFFLNYEEEKRTDPATQFVADNGSNTGQPNVSRVKQSDLDALSTFLTTKLSYDPGQYQGYSFLTNSKKALAKIDWNINKKNKFSVRYNYLKSFKDINASSSGTFTGRFTGANQMNFSNNNYAIHNDINSIIGQLNTRFSNKISNELIFGYTANRDYRELKGGSIFPLVDILDGTGDRNFISFGSEPFTPNNILNTDTWQASDNITFYLGKHTLSAGANFESFKFFNQFTPNIQGQYVFNSLADFYTSANAYLANPTMTQNPVNLRRYILAYSNLPDNQLYNAVTNARSIGTYVQDEWQIEPNLSLTFGVRFDVPYYPSSNALTNSQVAGYSFVDENGNSKKLSTSQLPSAKLMINPRFGFNMDIKGDKTTQVRGGLGLFSGRQPFVFISNAVGNNGLQNGTISRDNTNIYPFSPNVNRNIPANITPGTPAASYTIAPIEKEFRSPQVFRTNLAVDQKLFAGIIGSAEVLFSQNLSNIFYYNANQKPATTTFSGPDNRPRFAGSNSLVRINPNVTEAPVLSSRPYGSNSTVTLKIEKPLTKNFSWLIAYNLGYSKDYMSASTIAFSSFTSTRTVNGNNLPDYSFSDYDLRHRIIGNITYRIELAKTAGLQISLYGQSQSQGRFSYGYSGDLNGDGISGNDLLYIPRDNSQFEMNFEQYTATINNVLTTFTVQQQKDAFEAFIQQDDYLKNNRGTVAKRNGVLQPRLTRFDLSTMLELFRKFGNTRHTIQFRADIFNVGNLINHKWGVADIINTTSPVAARPAVNNVPVFRYNLVNNSLNYSTYRKGTSIADVFQAQLGIRYIF